MKNIKAHAVTKSPALILVLLISILAPAARAQDADSDGDGLSDFQEIHKYFTDPHKADSDGDGIPDGDRQERREYAYTVRSVAKVMRPVNLAAITNDDYQDARVRSQTPQYVELEVIHYPLNTVAQAIQGRRDWQHPAPELQPALQPGLTTNWDEAMRADLLASLKKDGIDPAALTDREAVTRVAPWLMHRAKYTDMFGTYFVHFPGGQPQVLPGLEAAFKSEQRRITWPLGEQFDHELFGKGMYFNRSVGSCTSTAIYLTTALRALGIPTRMIVVIPVIDPSDPAQLEMLKKGVGNNARRVKLKRKLGEMSHGFTAHTFNEVYVDGRWRRLNYTDLGANIDSMMGLVTHVHTFNDLSEAGLTEIWGKRYGLGERDAIFKTGNPYRATEISDQFGVHGTLANPEVKEIDLKQVTISKAYWLNSPETPAEMHQYRWGGSEHGEHHLFIHGEEWDARDPDYTFYYRSFKTKADPHFVLRAAGHPDARGDLSGNDLMGASKQFRELEIRFDAAEYRKLAPGVAYQLVPLNAVPDYQWVVVQDLRLKVE